MLKYESNLPSALSSKVAELVTRETAVIGGSSSTPTIPHSALTTTSLVGPVYGDSVTVNLPTIHLT